MPWSLFTRRHLKPFYKILVWSLFTRKPLTNTSIFFGFWKCHKQAAISILQKECLNSKLTFWLMNFFIFSADMQKRYEMFALCIRVLAASTGFHRKFTISVFLSKHLFFIMGIYFTPLNEMGALYNRYVWCTAV